MPTLNIDIDVHCDCGISLVTTVDRNNDIIVEPCEKCMEKERDEAYQQGVESVEKEG